MASAALHPLSLLALAASLIAPSSALCGSAVEPAPPPAACVGDARVGLVVAVSGAVYAHAPGEPPRGLACDAVLSACEEIMTAPGASLAFLAGDVLVLVGGDARVALAGREAAPKLFVQHGALRSTDGRRTGATPVGIGSRDLAASGSGADVEIEASATGPSRLCSYAGRTAVHVGAASRTLGSGECLAAQGGGVVTFAAERGPELGLEAAGFCAFDVALDDSLTPGDVAAPPLPAGAPDASVPSDSCDGPGAGCSTGKGDVFDDPDPVPGCDSPGAECGGHG